MMHTIDSSIQWEETGGSMWLGGPPGLNKDFQASQVHSETLSKGEQA